MSDWVLLSKLLKVFSGFWLIGELGEVLIDRILLVRLVWTLVCSFLASIVVAFGDVEKGVNNLIEMSERISGTALSFGSQEVFLALWVSPLVRLSQKVPLSQKIYLTFFLGRPRPRPELGGVRISPSGPYECFCFK